MKETSRFSIRRMQIPDLDQVMEIETVSFASPWSRRTFQEELSKKNGTVEVVVQAKNIVGYIIAWIIVDEIHIGNIAVHPHARRLGIAEAMIRNVLDQHPSCRWVGLEVRRSNLAARSLYEKLGFVSVGVRKNYYAEEGEDAILMTKTIP